MQADITKLGQLLLDDVDYGNRLRCALIVRVEERKLLEVTIHVCYFLFYLSLYYYHSVQQEILVMVNGWINSLESQGSSYIPPEANASLMNSTAAEP